MDKQSKQESVLLKRLLLLTGIYTLFRIAFLIIYRTQLETSSTLYLLKDLLLGIRFDLSAIIFTNAVFLLLHLFPLPWFFRPWYQRILKILFYIFNIPAFLLNIVDLVYYRFTVKRTTGDILNYLSTGGDFKRMFLQYAKDFWYVIVIVILLVYLLEYLYKKIEVHTYSIKSHWGYILRTIAGLASIPIFVIGARGGLQYRPLSILNASEGSNPKNAPLILNSTFTFIKTLGEADLEMVNYMAENEAKTYFNPEKKQIDSAAFPGANIVLIIMEGFGKEFVGELNHTKGYTPFIDSLCKEGKVFINGFANGKRSIEGIPAIVASLPSLMDNAYITSSFAGNQITSLANILGPQGYETGFFHGGNNGTMGFDIFSRMAGYGHYYGRNEYRNDKDYDGKWGIFDEPFFQFMAHTLNTYKQPFFATLFSLSSHHPYTLPQEYQGKFREGTLPIHPTVQYADLALRRFFETASKEPWFNKTLFVITADHTSLNESAFYNSPVGVYSIPIIFYYPGKPDWKGTEKHICQQADITPAILGLIGTKKPYICYGNDPFDKNQPHFAVNYQNNNYQFIEDGFVLDFNGKKFTGLYNYQKDSTQSQNLLEREPGIKEKMGKRLLSYIQQYNSALLSNHLVKHEK